MSDATKQLLYAHGYWPSYDGSIAYRKQYPWSQIETPRVARLLIQLNANPTKTT